jgi:hypothetical protein
MNCIEFTFDSKYMLVGGGSSKGYFLVVANASIKSGKVSCAYLDDQKNVVPTVISRFAGQDVFLVGVSGSVYAYSLQSNIKLEQIHKFPNVCLGIITDICIKGNIAYCKGSQEPEVKILVFNYQASKSQHSEIAAYNSCIIRPYQLQTATNLEKISYDRYHRWIYVGGTLGLTALKEDGLTKDLIQVSSSVDFF